MDDSEFSLTAEKITEIRDIFSTLDVAGNGTIQVKKIGDIFKRIGCVLKPNDLREVAEAADNGTGSADLESLLHVIEQKMKEKYEEQFYKNMFRILDKDKKGYIPAEGLRKILKQLAGEVGLDEDDIDDMIDDIDEDGNGEVSFDEFFSLMTAA